VDNPSWFLQLSLTKFVFRDTLGISWAQGQGDNMVGPGRAAAPKMQSQSSGSKFSRFKNKLGLHIKSEDRKASAKASSTSRGKDRNEAATGEEQQAAATLETPSKVGVLENSSSTNIKETVQSPKNTSTTSPSSVSASIPSPGIKEIVQSQKSPSNTNTTGVSVSSPSPEIKQTIQSSTDISAVDSLCPIYELWNQAYDDLKTQDEKLIKDYEAALCRDLATMIGSTVTLSGSKVERKDQMATLLARKVEEVKKNTWKLKFSAHDIPLKDLAGPVVSLVQWANDYISGALSANPYASLAWGGVSLLLPVSHKILTHYLMKGFHLCIAWKFKLYPFQCKLTDPSSWL
jgi:hypothetical protein